MTTTDIINANDTEDLPDIKIPILDDFITPQLYIDLSLWERIEDLILSAVVCGAIFLSEKDEQHKAAQLRKNFRKAQVRAMIPNIVRFQRRHLWEHNKYGQLIRNKHNVVSDRKIQRLWDK